MAAAAASQAVVQVAQVTASTTERCKQSTVSQSSFLGQKGKKSVAAVLAVSHGKSRIVCQAQGRVKDRWSGLGNDISDDQQDISRGKGMVDSLFQGAVGMGTQNAVLSSYDYVSQGQRSYQWDNMKDGYYIAPAFMDKIVVHLAKNFMDLPSVKVPLILGVWGGKGQGKSFQAELIFAKLGINPIVMSAGELESGNAGEPAKLIRQRYREASDIIKKGKMCCLFINDLDAGAGRMGGTTQYTVNNQMVNATLMNIADNPTNVQLPGVYNKEEIPRVPVIVTGNDFSTLYAPLIRDGRMEKFYWAPTREDRIGVCEGIFSTDGVSKEEVTSLVDTFPGQSIDFFGALRARVYDDEVRKWVAEVGVENIGKKLINSRDGPVTFERPPITLERLMQYGFMLVKEQENVKRVQLADKYLDGAELGNANEDEISRVIFQGKSAQQFPVPVKEGCADPHAINYDPTARSDNGSCVYDFSEPSNKSSFETGNGSSNGSLDNIVPIYSSARGRGPARGRGRRMVLRARPESSNGSYLSSFSDSESDSFSPPSSSFDSYSAPASPQEIIPIISKKPGALPGRGRGRKRGLPRSPRPSGENGAYTSGSDSDAEGYYSDSTYNKPPAAEGYYSDTAYKATTTSLDDIVPIISKNPGALPGRGRGRRRGPPRTGRRSENGAYSSGSESEGEGYLSDTTPVSLDDIVPIIAKSKPVRGGILKKRGRRPGSRSGSESGSESDGYLSSSTAPVSLDDIVPIIAKSKPVRGGILKKRGLRKSGNRSGSGSGSDSEGYFTDSGYSTDSAAASGEIVPIISKNPGSSRGRGSLRKRGGPRRRTSGTRSDGGYTSYSDNEGYGSDSAYAGSSLGEIVPIIAKSKPVRGGILKKRGLRRSGNRSGSGSGSGSGSDSEGYYTDSAAPATNEIVPIIAKNPSRRSGGILKKRGRPRASSSGSQSDGGYTSYSDASDNEGYYSDSPSYAAAPAPTEIVPIIAKGTTRGRGILSKKRGLRKSKSGSGSGYSSGGYSSNGYSSTASDSDAEGYYSDRTYSYSAPEPAYAAPEPVATITPIYAKTPAGRGSVRGRGRGRR